MAVSGSIQSNWNGSMFLQVDWYRVSYDVNNQTATYNVSAYFVNNSNTVCYRIYGNTDSNYINVAGVNRFTVSEGGNGTQSNPRRAYGPITAYDADRTAWYANWTEGAMYVYAYAHLITNLNITVPISDNGTSNFNINAVLTCSKGTFYIGTTIVPDNIEVFSKVPYKSNGSWGNSARIWHKENGVWNKRKFYHKENGNWVKK
jgi:hypothetical protein